MPGGQRFALSHSHPGAADALPVDETLEICRQIAEGLEAAHEKGVVHRDLKPANVKVTPEDKVKILDFGLAKAVLGEISSPDATHSQTITAAMTRAGVVLGTAAYMSPEQAKGKLVDKRADIWAFGCVLFECLSGRPVFEAETVAETIAAILNRELSGTRCRRRFRRGSRSCCAAACRKTARRGSGLENLIFGRASCLR